MKSGLSNIGGRSGITVAPVAMVDHSPILMAGNSVATVLTQERVLTWTLP